MSKRVIQLPLLLTAVCLLLTVTYGQSSTATLSGTVEDEKGALVPGAAVTIHNRATSLERHATTNDSGSFTIPLLPPGEYTVLVEREGFTRVQLTGIILNVGDQKAVSVQLKVGDIKSEVLVTADASLVSTSPAVANTIDRNFVQNLPLNGRSFQSLILLTPGVTVVSTGNGAFPGDFSVNGQRQTANIYTVDGVSANTGPGLVSSPGNAAQSLAGNATSTTTLGGTNGIVSVDALEEFKILTSTYSAEFGRSPGGQVSLVTRSGNNQFQGSLVEYFRNEKLDANDWFANAGGRGRSPLRQNIFGGTLGGPVFLPRFGEGGPGLYNGRNHTFFFASYERIRLLLPQSSTRFVPSLRVRDLAPAPLRKVLYALQLPTGSETTTTTVCAQPAPPLPPDPTCAPNNRRYSGLAPSLGVYSDPSTLDVFGLRIDQNIGGRLRLFGRYNRARSNSEQRGSTSVRSFSQVDVRSNQTDTFTFGATWTIAPTIMNESRLNVTKDSSATDNRLDSFGGAVPVNFSDLIAGVGLGGVVQSTISVSLPGVTGGSFSLSSQTGNYQNQINVVDNLAWVKGRHTFKFGVDYRRLSPTYLPIEYSQSITFTTEARIQQGLATTASIFARKGSKPTFTNYSFYGQDTWQMAKGLTLDLGLRWDINPPPGGSAKLAYTLIGAEDIRTATVAPPGTSLYKTDFTAFAPRVGAAYQLFGQQGHETIIRGGFGVYFDTGNGSAAGAIQGFPFSVTTTVASSATAPVAFPLSAALSTPPPFPTAVTPTTALTAFSSDYRLPYTLQWTFGLEQSLGKNQTLSATYVAALGRALVLNEVRNRTPTLPGIPVQNTNFGQVSYVSNLATSDFHSLQVQFRRRLTRGLQALANYTWAHAIDVASNESVGGISGLSRANANFDVRHNFSSAISYDLPSRKTGGVFGTILSGWSVDAIVHAQSAQPVDIIYIAVTLPDGSTIIGRPDLVPGQPLYIDDPNVAGGRRFNPAAFTAPPLIPPANIFPVRQGTLGRNVLRGLPLYQVDLGLRRKFNLTEKLNLQLRGEAFNVFNHPNFAGYGATARGGADFGVPSQMLGRALGGLNALYQIGGPRSIQLSIKLGF